MITDNNEIQLNKGFNESLIINKKLRSKQTE